MDTREKILTPEQAIGRAREARQGGARVTLVTGHFDPLLAEHAGRLNALAGAGGWLVVAVTDPPQPILPARARAELVAGLRAVDCVVTGSGAALMELVRQLRPEAVFAEEVADLHRAREFMAHVRARQGV